MKYIASMNFSSVLKRSFDEYLQGLSAIPISLTAAIIGRSILDLAINMPINLTHDNVPIVLLPLAE
jgi:hypothetical protein